MSERLGRKEYYDRKRVLGLGRNAVDYIVIDPEESNETPANTVLLVPGIVTGLRGMSLLGDQLHEQGYRTVAMSHGAIGTECPQDVVHMVRALCEGDVTGRHESVMVAAHSLGAIHTVKGLASMNNPQDTVEGVLLLAPTGYGGVHPEKTVQSLLFESYRRPSNDYVRDVVGEALIYTAKAGPQLIHKIREARDARVIENTRELQHRGIPFTAVKYPFDQLINYQELTRGLDAAEVYIQFDVDHRLAGHNAHMLHPRRTGRVVLEALQYLEQINPYTKTGV